MKTPSVLLLEHPDGDIQHTRLPWADVTVHTQARAGAAAALKGRPDIILMSLRQSERNGLQIARVIRKRLGPEPIIVVYGRPSGVQRRVLRDQRDQIRSKWGVDRFLGVDPSGSRLADLVQSVYVERYRSAGAVAVAPSAAPAAAATAEVLASPQKPGMTVIIRQEMRQAVREATARARAPHVEKPASAVARFFQSILSFFRRASFRPSAP